MAVNNSLAKKTNEKPKFSVAIQSDMYKILINRTLGDPKRAQRFIASISSAVAVNPALQECEAGTILSCALLGEALNLSPSPQLGQYYIVPYKKYEFNSQTRQRELASTTATFQLGYRGYIQLAIRSGNYKKINALPIKEGELIRFDPLNEEIEVHLIEDEDEREAARTVGYYAMFEYHNGFRKVLYWTLKKMERHADTYSQAFNLESFHKLKNGEIADKDLWKYSSYWYKNFDDMALKTMLRQLISKWGQMSAEMQEAFEKDMAEIRHDGTYEYVDNTPDVSDVPAPHEPHSEPDQPVAKDEPAEVEGDPLHFFDK